MSNKETITANNNRIATNNTDLTAILETVNGLPLPGEGGGKMLTGGALMWQYDAEDDIHTAIFWGNLEAGKNYEVRMNVIFEEMLFGVFAVDWVDSGIGYEYLQGLPVVNESPFAMSLTDLKTQVGGIFEEMAFDGIQLTLSGAGEDLTEQLMAYWYIKEFEE